MKSSFLTAAVFASLALLGNAATINWSAGVDHGLSLANGTELPTGALVRLGHFRDPGTGTQLSDVEIQGATPAQLEAAFLEAGTTTVGSGFSPALTGHFSAASTVDTGSGGLNLAGKQMYLWVLNGPSLAASTQHAIFYWVASDTTTNPDSSPQVPGVRWVFPPQEPIPGSTTVDVTDLTNGTAGLAAGARLVIGSYPNGVSSETSASNFGLATIDAPLAIPTASSLAGGVVSTVYSATVVAQGGRSPYDFSVTAGTLPAGLTIGATTGVIGGTPTASGSSTFEITVEDDLGGTLAKSFTIVVAGSPLAISTAATLPSASQNQVYTQALAASGGTAPLAWSLSSGSLPVGLTLATDGTISGTPTGSGLSTFTVEVSDAGALVDTETFSLTVLVPPAISPGTLGAAVVGLPYTQTFSVPSTGPLNWSVTPSQPGGLSFNAGVLSGTPAAAGSINFTVQVVGPAGTSTQTYTLTVLATAVAPTVEVPDFEPTSVGSTFSYTLSAAPLPQSFIVTGLPPGLKVIANTGAISGSPTKAGVYVVRVKAKNSKGTSGEVAGRLIVQALPTGAVGTFLGHVARETAVNGNLGGRIDLTTTATGTYTLKLTQGLVTTTQKGFLKVIPGNDPTISDTTATGITIALDFDSATNSFAGDITVGAASAVASGWRSTWNKVTAPASFHAGHYSIGMSLTGGSIGDLAIPQGHSFASFAVGLDGKLTVKGKTADGNAITCAGFMGSNGEILVFQQLYKKLGSLIGQVDMTLDPNKTFIENSLDGDVTWSKPAIVGTTYPAAFGPIDLDTTGMFLATSPKGSVVQGLPATGNAALMFDSSGQALNSDINPDVAVFTFNALLKPVLPLAGAAGNLGKATLLLNVADGSFKGAFTLQDGTVKRTVPYQGVIVRSSSGTIKGMGYFLAPQVGSTQKLAGTVTIEQ